MKSLKITVFFSKIICLSQNPPLQAEKSAIAGEQIHRGWQKPSLRGENSMLCIVTICLKILLQAGCGLAACPP